LLSTGFIHNVDVIFLYRRYLFILFLENDLYMVCSCTLCGQIETLQWLINCIEILGVLNRKVKKVWNECDLYELQDFLPGCTVSHMFQRKDPTAKLIALLGFNL
jgi:hypothetical protein